MAITIEMPKLSDTMSEGKVLSWKKQEGDAVEPGDILAEIESDKANMEMEVYDAGYIRKLLVPEGGAAPVGAPIAVMTEELDEDISDHISQLGSAKEPAPAAAAEPQPAPSAPAAPAAATTVAAQQAAPPPARQQAGSPAAAPAETA